MPQAKEATCTRCGKKFYRVGGMFGRKICPECRKKQGEKQNALGEWVKE